MKIEFPDQKNTHSDKTVVLLCGSGRFQAHLAHTLSQDFNLTGIVIFDPPGNRGSSFKRMIHLLGYLNPIRAIQYLDCKLNLPQHEKEAENKLAEFLPTLKQTGEFPDSIQTLSVTDINSPETVEFIQQLSPDAVCVNGTNLLRAPMLELSEDIKYGIINLHTGISPYSRGGNCNLFMLLEGKPELVGATIHYIDKGIDSGDIIETLRPEINSEDPYEFIEAKVFLCGIDRMIECLHDVFHGSSKRTPQWTKGKLFLKRTGYLYSPHIRLKVNRLITKGLVKNYLTEKNKRDAAYRLVTR